MLSKSRFTWWCLESQSLHVWGGVAGGQDVQTKESEKAFLSFLIEASGTTQKCELNKFSTRHAARKHQVSVKNRRVFHGGENIGNLVVGGCVAADAAAAAAVFACLMY